MITLIDTSIIPTIITNPESI